MSALGTIRYHQSDIVAVMTECSAHLHDVDAVCRSRRDDGTGDVHQSESRPEVARCRRLAFIPRHFKRHSAQLHKAHPESPLAWIVLLTQSPQRTCGPGC